MPVVSLTDRFVQTVKPPDDGAQVDYFDASVKGLSLRVSPAGGKAWFLLYTKPGDRKRARLKLGGYPEVGLAAARKKARDRRAEVGEGKDPIAEKAALAASQRVRDLVENYIGRQAGTKRSADAIARRLRKNVSEVIGDVRLSALHRRDLTRVIDTVKDRGALTEANRVFEDMRAMVRWARGRGDLDANLMEGMPRPAEATVRDRVLSAEEIAAVWRELSGAGMHASTKRILQLCLVTAQRVGEVAGIAPEELDLEKAVWTIPEARSKNKRAHVVPLSAFALAIIEEQRRFLEAEAARRAKRYRHDPEPAGPWLFPAPGGRQALGAPAVAKAVLRQLQGKGEEQTILGARPWTPHDLRRTAATHMEELGISPFVVGHVLNHVSITKASITSRVYARYDYGKEKREALDLWAGRLAGLTAAAPVADLRLIHGEARHA